MGDMVESRVLDNSLILSFIISIEGKTILYLTSWREMIKMSNFKMI
jgi:hypothetical protein